MDLEEDEKAVSFSDSLFTYLWCTQNIITEHITAKLKTSKSEFVENVSRAVLVLSSLSGSTINKMLESYFNSHNLSRLNVFTFLSTYCFDYHARNKDIFEVVLHTCTFVYKTMLFCYSKGKPEFLDFAAMCWADIFRFDIKKDFYDKGGWKELERYIKVNCNVSKDKMDIKEKYIEFLHDINNILPTLTISDEEEYISTLQSVSASNAKVLCADSSNCQDPVEILSTSMCEANISEEEAIDAYLLLEKLYGHHIKTKREPLSAQEASSMEHVYKTLTNFINQGLIHVEADTGKIKHSKLLYHNVNSHELYCSNCHEEHTSPHDTEAMIQQSFTDTVQEVGSKTDKSATENQLNTR